MVIIEVSNAVTIVSLVIGVAGVAFGVLSWINGRNGNRDAKKSAEKQEQLMKRQTQAQLFSEYSHRNQEIKNQLTDPTKKLISRQQFIKLCRDEYVSKTQGFLSEKEWESLYDDMLGTITNDVYFLEVWKGYSSIYPTDFISFFDDKIIRKAFPREFNTKI